MLYNKSYKVLDKYAEFHIVTIAVFDSYAEAQDAIEELEDKDRSVYNYLPERYSILPISN